MKLTPQQKKFVDEYLVDLNATRAYKAAYKACKKDETARTNASRLLTNANIKDYVDKRMKDREKRTEISQDRVLKEYAKLGFSDISDYLEIRTERVLVGHDPENNEPISEIRQIILVKDTKDIPKDKLAAIESVKHGKYGIEFKLYDKKGALDSIARHLGMFNDKVEVRGTINVNNPFAGLSTEDLKKLIQND